MMKSGIERYQTFRRTVLIGLLAAAIVLAIRNPQPQLEEITVTVVGTVISSS